MARSKAVQAALDTADTFGNYEVALVVAVAETAAAARTIEIVEWLRGGAPTAAKWVAEEFDKEN